MVATGSGRRQIVRDDIDRRRLVSTLGHVAANCHWECQAYCVLDTHLHLVVLTHEATLASGMRRLLGGHARRFNDRHELEGHVWTQRYYSSPIDTEAYLLEACAYVVLNPVRAGVCAHPSEWPWSSYRGTAGLETTAAVLGGGMLLATLHPNERRARKRWVAWVDGALATASHSPPGSTAVSD